MLTSYLPSLSEHQIYSSVNTLQKEGMQDKAAAGGCDFVAHPIDYNHALFPRCAHGPALVFARFKQVSGHG